MNLLQELIKIAETDLKSAVILYNNSLYPQAVFSFQQSVEKATKGFGIFLEMIEPKDLKKNVRHESIIVFEKMFQEIKSNCEALESDGTLKYSDNQNLDSWLSMMERMKKSKDGLISLPAKKIESYIELIEKKRKKAIKVKRSKDRKQNKDEKEKSILKQAKVEVINKFVQNNPELFKKIREAAIILEREIEKMNREWGNKILEIVQGMRVIDDYLINFDRVFLPLLYLCVLTLPHSVITRYPQNDKSPREIYTRKLPLVKMLPKLIKIQNKVIKAMDRLVAQRM